MNNNKNNKGSILGVVIIIVIVMFLYSLGNSGSSEDTCNYDGCTNPVYSYKNNLNGYCEKHKRGYENWKATEDLKRYIDSNK